MLKNALFSIAFLATSLLFSQVDYFLVDIENKVMPLTKIVIQSDTILSDATGKISSISKLDSIPPHYYLSNDTIHLDQLFYPAQLNFTSIEIKDFVKKIIKNSSSNNLQSFAPFSYSSYNKFIIHSTKLDEGEKLVNKWLNKLNFKIKDTTTYHENRHLVITESISDRNYYNSLNENEIVKWSKLSGVDQALFLSLNSQLQTIDIYDKHLRVLSNKLVNPFHIQSFSGYHFFASDTINIDGDEWVKIEFHPKKFTRFEAIKGFAWISTNRLALTALYCEPVYGRRMKTSYAIQFRLQQKKYVPAIISTSLVLNNVSNSKMKITARQTTYINDFGNDNSIIKKQFSDLAFTYRIQQLDSIERPVPLNKLDSITYNYFDKDTLLKINNSLKWGEQLFFGKFHTKHMDLDLDQIIDYNTYEKIRLGLGVISNKSLSDDFQVKGDFAYGFGDNAWKGGLAISYKLIKDNKLTASAFLRNDIYEAGALDRALVKNFYSTEFLRRFHLFQFNQQQHSGFTFYSKPFKYLNSELCFDFYRDQAKYVYQYKNGDNDKFREVRLALRYAYGERYFRFYDEQISLKSDYPIVWLTLEKSLPSADLDYSRIQLRARYTHHFIMNGTTKIELSAGKYWGDLPYFKLFNGLGSSSLKASIQNAFETMAYNEFASDAFAVLFYSHDFGHFNFSKNKTFRPHIELALNYGIGGLKNPEDHNYSGLKSFDKGFAEAGIALKDLILFYPFGVKIGIGASFYHRLLSYKYPTFRENSIFKLTTGFVI